MGRKAACEGEKVPDKKENELRISIVNLIKYIIIGLALNVYAAEPPNVILIMTDDQGYGDISCHGNPVLKTPEMDKLHEQSVRFTDFHVTPKCTPTRGQLMTGIDAMRNGATRVCQGRSLPRPDLKMMPQFFADAGYATGMFGKWHLGDSYPYPPRFRGFQEVLTFRAWGFTSLADHWGNDYFDPVLMHNGVDSPYEGYCTDIFFDEAIKWMKQKKDKPFFLYLPTNTPHVPEQVAEKYAAPYQGKYEGKKIPSNFYGMIANIDENLGRLDAFLKKEGLLDNTILLYLSDNGTQNSDAMKLYNAGMRSKKGNVWEGGHRVPLFIRWPQGGLQHGTDITELTTVQDLLPTLMDLCKLPGERVNLTGTSLAGLLKGTAETLPERMVVNQIGYSCKKWSQAVVMKDSWRMLKTKKGPTLFNIADDPHQDNNVFKDYPEVAQTMAAHYDHWYKTARPLWEKDRPITIGTDFENPLTLYANDWHGDYCDNRRGLIAGKAKGSWDLIVDRDGMYEIELRRWPEESGKALTDSFDAQSTKGAIPVAQARLQIADVNQTQNTQPEDTVLKFSVKLKKGKTKLTADLLNAQGKVICGAMYVKVKRRSTASQKPNVVVLFIDDMGYGDIGPFGSSNKTPHLDRMAKEGMVLTDFYVSSTKCTPSRAALLTGCYADRIGMDGDVVFPGDPRGLNPSEITIAEMMKAQGYATGCFGKWHLGDMPQFMPLNQGFDEYEGIPYSNDMWVVNKKKKKEGWPPLPYMKQDKAVAHIPNAVSQAVLSEATTSAAVDFITRHRDEPFFAYVPYSCVHLPRLVRKEWVDRADGDVTRAQIEELDAGVGRILATLRELGLEQDTLVFFTSDNGGSGGCSMGPLRGGKGGPKYEGHMRVPTLAWWPGKIQAGSVMPEIASSIDLFPTLAELCGGTLPEDRIIDGKDVSALLLESGAKSPHEILYYEYEGIRKGKWKLVYPGAKKQPALYDLENDQGERKNLASQYPERAAELDALLKAHKKRVTSARRPAGKDQQPESILTAPCALPTLAEYMGKADIETAGNIHKQLKPKSTKK